MARIPRLIQMVCQPKFLTFKNFPVLICGALRLFVLLRRCTPKNRPEIVVAWSAMDNEGKKLQYDSYVALATQNVTYPQPHVYDARCRGSGDPKP